MTYEETLQALQGMLGELVAVNVGPADADPAAAGGSAEGLTAGFWGVLQRAEPVGYETAQEALSFQVAMPGVAGVGGVFILSPEVFDAGGWNSVSHHPMVTIYAAGMRISVTQRPRPLGREEIVGDSL